MSHQPSTRARRPSRLYPRELLRALAEAADASGDWRERARCAETDPDAFFPDKGASTRQAKEVCAACEVRAECLQDALKRGERFGVWGGLSDRERRRLQRRTAPAPAIETCPRHALALTGGPVVFDCPAGHALYAAELPEGPRRSGTPAA